MAITHKALPLNGSANLNFNVVGGITAPTNPKENTIWVNTEVPISSYRLAPEPHYILSETSQSEVATSTLIFHADTTTLTTQSVGRTAIFECLPNTIYTINKDGGNLWYIATSASAPADGTTIQILTSNVDSSNTITVTTGGDANYLYAFVSNASEEPTVTIIREIKTYTRLNGNPLQVGDIWIKTVNLNGRISFNALKKNIIDTNISKVKQWNGSKWVNMIGEVYQNGALVLDYNNLPTVIDSNLYNEETLINVASGKGTFTTEGTTVYTKASSGAYFGYNVSRFNTDIRDYSLVSMQYTTSNGGSNYYPDFIFVGTEEQIAGVKFTAYNVVDLNGCTQISGRWGYSGETEFLADLSEYQDSAVPMYIGCIVGGYNGGANTFGKVTLDASVSSAIYGNSTTVQPPAYVVNVWRRTA